MELCWVGPRESDIDYVDGLFCCSVTVYGSGKKGNHAFCEKEPERVNHNIVTDEQIVFNSHIQQSIIDAHPGIRFMSYNPYYAHIGDEETRKRTICLNSLRLIERFRDKLSFRKFASQFVAIPMTQEMSRNQCSYGSLRRSFPGFRSFVVQKRTSSGGLGTVLIDADRRILPPDFRDETNYMVSPNYARNLPVNIHAIIYDDAVLMLPPSIQIICPNEGRMLYRGADYLSFASLPEAQAHRFVDDARALCSEIGRTGFRGIIGLDAIITPESVLFLEANVRFQASSQILNKSLFEAGCPTLHELNMEAFSLSAPSVDQESVFNLENLYSNISYTESDRKFADQLALKLDNRPGVSISWDGYDARPASNESYLYRVLFNIPIAWPTRDHHVNVRQNLLSLPNEWSDAFRAGDATRLKLALLNQGARIEAADRAALESIPGFRMGVNSAIDLRVGDMVVNVPVDAPFTDLSPFSIRQTIGGEFEICYLDELVAECDLATVGVESDPSDPAFNRAGLLATDRLRLSYNDCCAFMEQGAGCAFCDVPGCHAGFDCGTAKSAFDWFRENAGFRHVLIGGGSMGVSKGFNEICALAGHIRRTDSEMPIYVMCLPPSDLSEIDRMRDAGVTEVAFNVELYDRDIAARVMPIKGRIPLENYWRALERAREVWPEPGAVKSALIVGLEPDESFLEGVSELARRGISPVLSVFRPLTGTKMAGVVPPSNEKLLELLEKAHSICLEHGVELGPSCVDCQNNTLNYVNIDFRIDNAAR